MALEHQSEAVDAAASEAREAIARDAAQLRATAVPEGVEPPTAFIP